MILPTTTNCLAFILVIIANISSITLLSLVQKLALRRVADLSMSLMRIHTQQYVRSAIGSITHSLLAKMTFQRKIFYDLTAGWSVHIIFFYI